MAPRVSLLILSYNRERFLAEAIESALRQTYRDFELLIWDDGSTDQSVQLAHTYADRDPRVRVVAAAHQGINPALHGAVAQTSAAFLGWVDSDDRLLPTALEDTLAVLQSRPELGMVYTLYRVIDADGQVRGLGERCTIPYSRDRLLVEFMTFHFRLLRRAALEQAGGINMSMPCAQDYDMCLRLSETTEVAQVAKPLYEYRVHPEAVSQARRYEQIMESKQAIERALVRRGLADRFEVEMEIQSRFSLRSKNQR